MNNEQSNLSYSITPKVDFVTGCITFKEIINGFEAKYIQKIIETREEAVRAGLIALGWKPPGAKSEAELALQNENQILRETLSIAKKDLEYGDSDIIRRGTLAAINEALKKESK